MSHSEFADASKHPFKFSEERRQEMKEVLKLLPAGPGLDYDKFIDDIEQNRTFAMFGYGSLIGSPSGEIDKQSRGNVKGWEKGCFSKDRHYRGTPEKLAVTMGALQTEDGEGILEGVLQEIIAKPGETADSFAARVIFGLKKFVDREVSLNPIYDYAYVDVENSSGGTSKALMCSSDPKNPLFLGRDGAPGGLSLEEKAAVIATSKGVPGASPRNTGMAYWRDHIQCCKLGGFAVSKEVQELVALAEIYRAELEFEDPALFKELTDIEHKNGNPALAELEVENPELFNSLTRIESEHESVEAGKGIPYDAPVYNVSVVSASDSPRRVLQLRDSAIAKADLLHDPLPAKDREGFIAVGKMLEKDIAVGPPTPVFH